MERGMLEVRSLITHSFSLDEVAKAFNIADKRSENCVKIMVRVD